MKNPENKPTWQKLAEKDWRSKDSVIWENTIDQCIEKYPHYSTEIKKAFELVKGSDLSPEVLVEVICLFVAEEKGDERDKLFAQIAREKNQKLAYEFARKMLGPIKEARANPKVKTYDDIAKYLNKNNHRTRRGKLFKSTSIIRIEKQQQELGLL